DGRGCGFHNGRKSLVKNDLCPRFCRDGVRRVFTAAVDDASRDPANEECQAQGSCCNPGWCLNAVIHDSPEVKALSRSGTAVPTPKESERKFCGCSAAIAG